MGVGPGPNQLFKDLGDDFRMIYESLCSFSHPDLMGLMLNSQTKANDFSLKMVIHNALLSIISIMGSAYPDLEIDYEEMLEEVKHHMNVINQNIQHTLGNTEWIEQMMALKDHPLGRAPFRREEINQQVFELVNMFNEHGDEEAKAFLNNKVQELLEQLEDNSSS